MSEISAKVEVLLQSLSLEERQLLSRVLKIEHEVLYSAKPRVREELIKAVREVIK